MYKNLRRYERFSVSLSVVLDFTSGKREARISDISLGGCFIDSIASVRAGEQISFKINFPARHTAVIFGEVVYVYPGIGFGLRFVHFTKTERKLLEQIILQNSDRKPESLYTPAAEKNSPYTKDSNAEKKMFNSERAQFGEIIKSIQEDLEDKN